VCDNTGPAAQGEIPPSAAAGERRSDRAPSKWCPETTGYRTDVNWATQISCSGIYVRSAPWSVGSQRYPNTSHGCLNVRPSHALWFYDNTKRGDIVEVLNTLGFTLSGTDGLGDWNIPWEQWKAGNATI
jgi:lipoprotein-anchoring transpeptidase ErfK/SrfK